MNLKHYISTQVKALEGSKKQSVVARSNADRALANLATEVMWLKFVLRESNTFVVSSPRGADYLFLITNMQCALINLIRYSKHPINALSVHQAEDGRPCMRLCSMRRIITA
ncbi:hypothetical protein L6164_000545 [Bauhinia variegata]|uniref:Uncharacterized protein n=1 Tax=Bauhinia variegata TaxID=167791 RepID=A0ACB9Q6T3_BAUVA|nr:hypothetical protein L6164_000545 [Bauhinia variegata]